MRYKLSEDPYLDPSTGIFRNLLGIRTQQALETAESRLTAMHVTFLSHAPLKGKIDLRYMQSIHKTIFGNLYDWAGKLRTVEISKGETDA